MMGYIISSSTIAKILTDEPKGDEISRLFGKVFEELYTYYMYLHSNNISDFNSKQCNQSFKDEFIYELSNYIDKEKAKELANKALKMKEALFQHKCIGLKPKTQIRKLYNEPLVYVTAQPDLKYYNKFGTESYIEFKTYPTTEYSIMQCKVFSWVIDRPVRLLALRYDSGKNNYIVEEKVVSCNNLSLPDIRDYLENLEEVDICDTCKYPEGFCKCYWLI